MWKYPLAIACTLALVCLASPVNADLILIDENFAGFTNNETYSGGVTVTWSDSDGSGGFERYTPPSGARHTDGTYDHDNNATTPQINLVGAVEVNDDSGNVTLKGSFALPGTVLGTHTLELDFGADTRANRRNATVQIRNVTDGRDILPTSGVVYGSGSNPDWKRNDFSGALLPSDAGDTLELRFHEPDSSGGRGLQLTNVNLILDDHLPEIHEVGGDNTIGVEVLTGTQSNETFTPYPDVDKVHFWGRSDCCQGRQGDFDLIIEDASNNELHSQQVVGLGSTSPYHGEISLGGTISEAAYVRVVQNVNETFQVAELQAFEVGTGINKAEQSQGGVASAKDSAHGGVPGRANDGNTNMDWGGGSIWHSGSKTGTWLEIELGRDLINADLTASLNAHDFEDGYSYVFELGSSDQITINEFGQPGVFNTILNVNSADIVIEAPWGLTMGQTYTLFDVDSVIGPYNSIVAPAGVDYSMLLVDGTVSTLVIPEPMTMLAVGLSVAGLGGYIRKRRRA